MSQAFVTEIERICAEVLSPLVEGDGGQLWLVSAGPTAIHLHLSGTCAGCPGATLTHEHFIAPAFRVVAPTTPVRTTTGALVPDGARRMRAGSSTA
jgi:Fe-S cluster biogenesis protein NfuA